MSLSRRNRPRIFLSRDPYIYFKIIDFCGLGFRTCRPPAGPRRCFSDLPDPLRWHQKVSRRSVDFSVDFHPNYFWDFFKPKSGIFAPCSARPRRNLKLSCMRDHSRTAVHHVPRSSKSAWNFSFWRTGYLLAFLGKSSRMDFPLRLDRFRSPFACGTF